MNKIHDWYKKEEVLFNLIRYLKYRELALIVPKHLNETQGKRSTRYLRAHNTQGIKYIYTEMLQAEKNKTTFNFYYSLAKFKNGIPKFTANLMHRKTTNWNINYWKEMKSYDCVIDIDAGDHSTQEINFATITTQEIFSIFQEMEIPFELRFTGCGFHFIIPSDFLPKKSYDPYNKDNIWKYCLKINKKLYENISEQIDYNINDSRRVVKIPYSLSVYEKQIYVCSPINKEIELFDFNIIDYEIENYISDFETPKIWNKQNINNQKIKKKFEQWLKE